MEGSFAMNHGGIVAKGVFVGVACGGWYLLEGLVKTNGCIRGIVIRIIPRSIMYMLLLTLLVLLLIVTVGRLP